MMTKDEWLAKVAINKTVLREYIDEWHPSGSRRDKRQSLPITAPTSEMVRQRLVDVIKTKDPVKLFDAALEALDFMTIHKLLDETWFGVPESTSCWKIPGFSISVDLMDDPPEPEIIDVAVEQRVDEINKSRASLLSASGEITLTCECCGFSQQFKDTNEAFRAGWDAPPHFTQVICCDLCPSSGIVLSTMQGKPKDSMHQKAHAHWREHGRPEEFDTICVLDEHFSLSERETERASMHDRSLCKIIYADNGVRKEWLISAHPDKDDSTSLEAHLKKWIPTAVFIGYEFPNEQETT
jgi:hypothetical protein